MLIDYQSLNDFVTTIFEYADTEPARARQVAEHLVEANLKGHDSHGVGMVPAYVRNISAGHLDVDANAELTSDEGAVLVVEGNAGFGQIVGQQAMTMAIERGQTTGVVCLAVRNCHHLGRIGAYGETCGRAGMVSLHLVNVVGHEPFVAPFGGTKRRMSTNPFCCVVPRPDDEPIVLDMATSAIAQGKVRVAHMKGDQTPEGALIDHEGMPTRDPGVLFNEPMGALGPFGSHKGSGLALMCELLGGGLAGRWTAQPGNPKPGSIINNMLVFVVRPEVLGDIQDFHDEVAAMVDYMHSTPPAAGVDRVLIAGEPERITLAERADHGIPVDDNTWSAIIDAAQSVGVTDGLVPKG